LAFHKSGIWPTDGSNIIKKITHPTLTSPQKTDGLKSPKSAKAICHFQIAYEKEPTVDKVKKVFSTMLHLSTQVAVLEHENVTSAVRLAHLPTAPKDHSAQNKF
jgi:hypothetical protein